MLEHAPESEPGSDTETQRWPAALLKTLRYVSWAVFMYSTPGLLLVVLLVTAWLVPGILVLLVIGVLQVPIYLLVRRLARPHEAIQQAPSVDPRSAADYWSGCTSAEFGSSRNT